MAKSFRANSSWKKFIGDNTNSLRITNNYINTQELFCVNFKAESTTEFDRRPSFVWYGGEPDPEKHPDTLTTSPKTHQIWCSVYVLYH